MLTDAQTPFLGTPSVALKLGNIDWCDPPRNAKREAEILKDISNADAKKAARVTCAPNLPTEIIPARIR